MAPALKTALLAADEAGVRKGAELLGRGQLVAFPTETVYGLGADAFNEEAVRAIFAAKGRPQDNPLIVHVCSAEMARRAVRDIPDDAISLMRAFWPGPLSIVLKKSPDIPAVVSAGLDTIALRMPGSPVALELIRCAQTPVAAPSANTSGKPSPTTAAHVLTDLDGRIPLILDGGACEVGVESTVIDLTGDLPTVLRPGHVTLEDIRTILPRAVRHDGSVSAGGAPASPGMKYRHYAPNARVIVMDGEAGAVAQTIRAGYDVMMKNGLRPLILCADCAATLYESRRLRTLGQGASACEQALFFELRRADDEGTDVIYFHFQNDMGLAVRNRIMKAAAEGRREV